MIQVRQIEHSETDYLNQIYSVCFPNEILQGEWIKSNMCSYPRMVYYVAEYEGKIVGYAHWSVKSGFRSHSIIELEQVAVMPEYGKRGIGEYLLAQSFLQYKAHLSLLGVGIKGIFITTREGNFAEHLYKRIFSVERQGTINHYGSGNEVILFKRYVE
jgi:N-acetylglutamate synthase-like GNAT family acetyltransferase